MKEDIEIGYMDRDIIDLIEKFFRLPYAFTKSSCSGRIVAIDAQYPWSREGRIIFKVHRPMEISELEQVLNRPITERLWINVMGPIIHAVAKDFDAAMKIIKMAREAGFKHSGILSVNEEGWVVELTTGVRANVLAKVGNEVVLDVSKLDQVLKVLNEVLLEGKKKLQLLERKIESEIQEVKGSSELASSSA
ncbi:hypothetical protein EYM_01005 [Ignicoccus islandicus DSM 13165]|uniref:tRNA(Phe) 7-((3-amino-3-carboxypropyl)-4-demethylwyosine(37)-N(4))-methyltransferase n=1 Tax=Ignicoccus islandicus DSM 13165 TaxID=940295 RepID=A0A0U3FZC2_9CREN|nr:hypothetical protein [Ignicoccus islandicus]ALU11436.1 hypothetical protein EYM_01005 [Ignicoccus islandicus DSM 13165]